MPGPRRGFSLGSVLMLLLTVGVLAGTVLFLRQVGKDSPVAAMRLDEIAGSFSRALTPAQQAELPAPGTPPPPVAAVQPLPAQTPAPRRLSMTIGGLLRYESDVQASQSFQEGGADILGSLAPYLHGDLLIAGFDQVIPAEPKRLDNVLVPEAVPRQIRAAGFGALLVPGIHSFDSGFADAQYTLERIRATHLQPLGLGPEEVQVLRVNGLSIAWLHEGREVNAVGQKAAGGEERAQLLRARSDEQLFEQVRALRPYHDVVVVSIAQGKRTGATPTAAQRTLARGLGQAGADLILGMGAEQVQEIEVYALPDAAGGQRDVLIAYSMGTLLTANRNRREALSGVLLNLTLETRPGGQGLRYTSILYTPTYVRKWAEGGKQRFAILPSAAQAPEGMSNTQKEAMQRSLQLIQSAFQGSPAQLYTHTDLH
jgi:hypothetical protein